MNKSLNNIPQNALHVLQWPDSPWAKTEEERAHMTINCKDAELITRVKGAGSSKTIEGQDVQIMHNGLLVLKNGYQGEWESKVIERLRGVHEPQEEKVFYEVLKRVDPGATMMELGSWWSYYSMWFLKQIPKSKAYCTEPDPENLTLGRSNAKLNGFMEEKDIHFRQYLSGATDGKKIKFKTEKGAFITVPVRTVGSIIEQEKINKLDILHFDIQGAELDTLKGLKKTIQEKKVRFLFISTHHYSISGDPDIHQECIDFIIENGGKIIAKHTVLESCSGDGLIVASFDIRDSNFKVKVTLQPTDESLFRSAEKDTKILAVAYDKLQLDNVKLQRIINELQKEVQDLRAMLEKEKNDVKNLKLFIEEITPLKKHIKRQVKLKASKKH